MINNRIDRYRDDHAPHPPSSTDIKVAIVGAGPRLPGDLHLVAQAELHLQMLRDALSDCIQVMEELPTLNGIGGLAVLEHAREVLAKTKRP